MSDEHFTVDGSFIEAWASLKSFRPKDTPPPEGGSGRNRKVDFHGEKSLNETMPPPPTPRPGFSRKGKGKEAKLCFMGHVLMENRHGRTARLTVATGTAEREAAEAMVEGFLAGTALLWVATRRMILGSCPISRGQKAVPDMAQNCHGRSPP